MTAIDRAALSIICSELGRAFLRIGDRLRGHAENDPSEWREFGEPREPSNRKPSERGAGAATAKVEAPDAGPAKVQAGPAPKPQQKAVVPKPKPPQEQKRPRDWKARETA